MKLSNFTALQGSKLSKHPRDIYKCDIVYTYSIRTLMPVIEIIMYGFAHYFQQTSVHCRPPDY